MEAREVKVENIEQDLLVKLTSEEMVTRAKRMAHLGQRMTEMDAARDSANKLAKGEIAKLSAERDSLANEITIGAKLSKVKCQEVFDYRLGNVRVIRLDTKEVVDERAMSTRERQPELPGVTADAPAKEQEADGENEDDDTPEERAAINPSLSAMAEASGIVPADYDPTEEEPDTSVLDAKDTEPPPALATEKKPRAKRGEGKGKKPKAGK